MVKWQLFYYLVFKTRMGGIILSLEIRICLKNTFMVEQSSISFEQNRCFYIITKTGCTR